MFLGIDIGSISVKVVALDQGKNITFKVYQRHKGQPLQTLIRILKDFPLDEVTSTILTGSGSKIIAELCSLARINEIKALTLSAEILFPSLSTLIEIGGQDSKLLVFKSDQNGKPTLQDFAMNSLCAAGTGSFLDQQANRLNIAIEEFGSLTAKSKNPPRIAGRCTVFAKSDMIHLQQKATPVEDILAGLCLAMARNFKSTVGKGKDFQKPVAFVGGVAGNYGMIKAFEEVLELESGQLIIPAEHALACALGAALSAMEHKETKNLNLKQLESLLNQPPQREEGLEPLAYSVCCQPYGKKLPSKIERKIKAYLGVDVGSISTNVVVMDEDKNVLAKSYLMTAGRPLEAVCQGITEVEKEVADKVEIAGVCTTGSGRYLTGDFIGADVVKNEITAQARAAVEIDKNVDTIFEIGGQDSKYISLENGAIIDSEMNKACAAGTGSYLEEQAEKLGINIEEEFGQLALSATSPTRLGDRCTVFMESDVVQNLQKGTNQQDISAGLAYSIVQNYLNRVVQGKKVGNNIFFQGGVAFNKAVVAAFEKVTGKSITVPEHHEVTGAIGCCLLAKEYVEQNGIEKSKFHGFEVSKIKYKVDSFECKGCANHCEVNKVSLEGSETFFYGHRCEKYEKKKPDTGYQIPDLFAERERLLEETIDERRKTKIGIPRALFYYWDFFPFFNAFFAELGCEVVLSDKTNKEIIHQGVEAVLAEPCFPIKVAHGHVLNLLKKDIDYLFLPSIMNLPKPNYHVEETHTCPYVLGFPSIIKAGLPLDKHKAKLISPTIFFRRGEKHILKILTQIGKALDKKKSEVKKAFKRAQEAQTKFEERIRSRGEEILENLDLNIPALVIVSRSYNGCDSAVNLEIPKVLRELGALAIPMDFLPLDEVDISKEWAHMYWRSGQKVLAAAEIIKDHPNLNAVYITNFGCGPDSFIPHFFKDKMADKPYLMIEIDEHSSDVGAVTRCEAFLDSLKNISKNVAAPFRSPNNGSDLIGASTLENRTLYLPNMCDHAYALAAAFTAFGIKAEVLPESDSESLSWGRKYTSGKECFPAQITTGDIVKLTKSKDFDPEKSAIFMPTVGGGCRFSYFHRLQRLILNELGLKNLPIYSPSQSISFYKDLKGLGINFIRKAFHGIAAIDMLEKCLYEIRPYEKEKGESDKTYKKYLQLVCKATQKKKDLLPILYETSKEFASIPISKNGRKPQIAIVGEIFVRSHRFSNENLILKIEELGGAAWTPPITEWMIYTSFIRFRETLEEGKYFDYLLNWITDLVADHDLKRLEEPFVFFENFHEPSMPKIEEWAAPYIDLTFRGEVVLGLGKSIDFIKKGVTGIINVMPFTCMPGNVFASLIKCFRQDHKEIPFISIAYDGLNEANNLARLEAFMDQCQSRISSSPEPLGRGQLPA